MSNQLEISIPYAKGSQTSKAAAESISHCAARQRSIVLGYIQANPGCTDEEIAEGLSLNPSSARPRRLELLRAGLIKILDENGKTKSGRHAARWGVK